MDPRLIVVSSDTSFEDRALVKLFADRPTEIAIANDISTAFEKEGLNVPVIDRSQFDDVPAGLVSEDVLFAKVRFDIATVSVGQSKTLVVGAVSIAFYRAGNWLCRQPQ